jgi:hypothetical protein
MLSGKSLHETQHETAAKMMSCALQDQYPSQWEMWSPHWSLPPQ